MKRWWGRLAKYNRQLVACCQCLCDSSSPFPILSSVHDRCVMERHCSAGACDVTPPIMPQKSPLIRCARSFASLTRPSPLGGDAENEAGGTWRHQVEAHVRADI